MYGPKTSTASTGFALPYRIRLAASKFTPMLSSPTSRMARTSVMGVSCPVSQRNFWPFLPAVRRHGADGLDRFRVQRVVGVLGDESAVALHGGDPGLAGEIRDLLHARDARLAVLRAAPGRWSAAPGRNRRPPGPGRCTRPTWPPRGTCRARRASLAAASRCPSAHAHLAGGKSEIVHAPDGGFGVLGNAEDDAQPHLGLRRRLLRTRLEQTARGGRAQEGAAVIGFHWRRFYPGGTWV